MLLIHVSCSSFCLRNIRKVCGIRLSRRIKSYISNILGPFSMEPAFTLDSGDMHYLYF